MKTALNIILIVNTLYILICSENQNASEFVFPLFTYVFFGFFRYYHKDFIKYLNTPTNHEKNS